MTQQILLSNGKGVALVDDADFELVSKFNWCLGATGKYAQARVDGKVVYMHRMITNALPGQDIDHADANKLNNQRANLRPCTRSQNVANNGVRRDSKTGFKGVTLYGNKYRATIQVNGKQRSLGYFRELPDAVAAYDKAARELFGSFSRPNGANERRVLD
jgi:hypothetical protein